MKKIICYGKDLHSPWLTNPSPGVYYSKRIKFWKWKLHRTMGRPILHLRKEI